MYYTSRKKINKFVCLMSNLRDNAMLIIHIFLSCHSLLFFMLLLVVCGGIYLPGRDKFCHIDVKVTITKISAIMIFHPFYFYCNQFPSILPSVSYRFLISLFLSTFNYMYVHLGKVNKFVSVLCQICDVTIC